MARRCLYENLNPSAMMMKSAKDRMRSCKADRSEVITRQFLLITVRLNTPAHESGGAEFAVWL